MYVTQRFDSIGERPISLKQEATLEDADGSSSSCSDVGSCSSSEILMMNNITRTTSHPELVVPTTEHSPPKGDSEKMSKSDNQIPPGRMERSGSEGLASGNESNEKELSEFEVDVAVLCPRTSVGSHLLQLLLGKGVKVRAVVR
jgi:hypothetical protein